MTLTSDKIMTQYRNALVYHFQDRAKCFTTSLHVRIDMNLLIFIENFFPMDIVKTLATAMN